MPEPNLKSLKRTILEFGSIIFLSEHCMSCRKKSKERKLVLIKFSSDVKVDSKEYAYFGVPLCPVCCENTESRGELIKKVDEALKDVPYKILVE